HSRGSVRGVGRLLAGLGARRACAARGGRGARNGRGGWRLGGGRRVGGGLRDAVGSGGAGNDQSQRHAQQHGKPVALHRANSSFTAPAIRMETSTRTRGSAMPARAPMYFGSHSGSNFIL